MGIDLATNKVERSYFFKSITDNKHSYLNDVRIDTARQFAYLTSSPSERRPGPAALWYGQDAAP